jgi:hypothetical protein
VVGVMAGVLSGAHTSLVLSGLPRSAGLSRHWVDSIRVWKLLSQLVMMVVKQGAAVSVGVVSV